MQVVVAHFLSLKTGVKGRKIDVGHGARCAGEG